MHQIDLESWVEVIPNPLFIKDFNHRWIAINQLFCDLLGYERDELLGKSDEEIFSALQVKRFYERDNKVLESGETDTSEEQLTDRSGMVHTIITKKNRLIIDGKPHIVGIITDISNQKQFQYRLEQMVHDRMVELENKQRFLQEVIDALPEILFVKDESLKHILVNNAYLSFLDRRRDEIIGLEDEDLLPYDAALLCRMQDRYLLDGVDKVLDNLEEISLPSGKQRWFQVRKQRFFVDNNSYIIGIAHEVTELIDTKTALIQFNESLQEQIDRALEEERKQQETIHIQARSSAYGEILSNIAHHWRQPLSVIGLCIENIKSDLVDSGIWSDEYDRIFKDMKYEIHYLSKTIDDFDTFMLRRQEDMPVAELLKELRKLLLHPISSYCNISVKENFQNECVIRGDSVQIRQIFLSIFQNAIDGIFSKDPNAKAPYGEIDITVSMNKSNECHIEISDNGVGMTPDEIVKVFDPYYTSKFKSRGTGLSLYLARKHILLIGGDIRLIQNSKGGITASLIFPIELARLSETSCCSINHKFSGTSS